MPGGRDVFAEVIRVAPPSNFYPSQLALAAGFALFHGQLLRKITGGQLPVVILLLFLPCSHLSTLAALPEVTEPR